VPTAWPTVTAPPATIVAEQPVDSGTCSSTRRSAIEARSQVLAAALLAIYPWVRAFGPADYTDAALIPWPAWLLAVGLHATWLYLRPHRPRLLPVASLILILGLIFIQGLVVYRNVVIGRLGIDYSLVASLIHASSRDLLAPPENLYKISWAKYFPPGSNYDRPGGFASYVQGYFDPYLPLLDRAFHLTSNPFLLMGLYATAILSASLVVWWVAVRNAALYSFQILLPIALLFHPALSFALQMEYHNDGIPLGLLILGSYCFFTMRRRSAFVLLLLGTMTKVSYWPSWLMFGVAHAFRREWRWSAAYLACTVAAFTIFSAIQPPGVTPAVSAVLGGLGNSPAEIAVNLVLRPHLWLDRALEPSRWYFLLCVLVPWAPISLAYWWALIPVVPLVPFSLLDTIGTRTMVIAPYTLEYVAFTVAATMVALRSAGRWRTTLVVATLTAAAVIPFTFVGPWGIPENQAYRWGETFPSATAKTELYRHEVEFGVCAVGDEPILATVIGYPSYIRGDIDKLWPDEGLLLKGSGGRLPQFGTLVYTMQTDGFNQKGLDDLKLANDPAYAEAVRAYYRDLNARLSVRVKTTLWDYRGGPRLAACAQQFGYPVERSPQ
jgi:uncharacterized membrane protein